MAARPFVLLLTTVAGIWLGIGAWRLLEPDRSRSTASAGPSQQTAVGASSPQPVPVATATPTSASTPGAVPTVPSDTASLPTRRTLAAIARGAASRGDGRVQLAITSGADRQPLVAASSGTTKTPFRLWSVSKVATAIALLEAYGYTRADAPPLPRPLTIALTSALVLSGDCSQRQLVLALQDRLGGIAPARAAIAGVLRRGGARTASVTSRASPGGSGCREFLRARGVDDPDAVALQLGAAEWTIRDAARFALALGDGTYPAAVTRRILALLRRPKGRSDDPFANGLDVTTDPAWGAGQAFAGVQPRAAYKAGWGGSSGETATFVTEQVISLRSGDGIEYGIALTHEPTGPRPVRDDPALTGAPDAFRYALRRLAQRLRLKQR